MASMNQQTIAFDVEKFMVYPFTTTDVNGGASPTYGTGVQVQGIQSVNLDPEIVSADLKGDGGQIISRQGRVTGYQLQAQYGRIGLDALAVMVGGTVSDTGTGASEVAEWDMLGDNILPFFKCEFDIATTDNGVADLHVVLYKCQLKSATFLDPKTEAFSNPKIDLEAIPLINTGKMGAIRLYAATTPLPS